MKRTCFVFFILSLTSTFMLGQLSTVSASNEATKVVVPTNAIESHTGTNPKVLENYGNLPLSFEANQGQTDARVKFLSRTRAYTVFFTGNEAVFELEPLARSSVHSEQVKARHQLIGAQASANARPAKSNILRMQLKGTNPSAKVSGSEQLPGTNNYFVGNDATKWRTNVPTYAKVKYEAIYPGINLIYYGSQRQLEYDFVVSPGADPRRIAFDVRGARRIRRNAPGDLVVKVGDGELRWHKPVAYQKKNGDRELVAARYVITGGDRVRFEVAKYDTERTLYIDPLIYSTYLGGSSNDYGNAIAVDSAGNAYVTGTTVSTDFPVTPGTFQSGFGGGSLFDVFVTKINPQGSALVYSTYLGGSSDDESSSIAVDSAGNAYVTGGTGSTDFPVTPGAFQTTCACGDAFLTKVNPSGSALVYSTYLGGSRNDGGAGLAVDSAGNAYVTGETTSTDFPVTPGAFQTAYRHLFVTKFDSSGSTLAYSTYLGGTGNIADDASGIAIDSAGNAYVTGETYSIDFPVTPGAFQTTLSGGSDAFMTKINADGSALGYATYLGGSGMDWSSAIAVDSAGNAFISGLTRSTDFPVTPGAFQTACAGGWLYCLYEGDAFVTKLNPTGSALAYSTYLGGSLYDHSYSIAVDKAGYAYVFGSTDSNDFPVTPGALKTKCPYCSESPELFVSRINTAGTALAYSTYSGGRRYAESTDIAVDSTGNAYLTGYADRDFPMKNPLQDFAGGFVDAFVTKLDVRTVTSIALSSSLTPSTYGQALTFTATVTSALGAPPDGETITFKRGTTILGTGILSGGSATITIALGAGNFYIKAVYGGDTQFSPSMSKALQQVVNKATTTTTLTSSLNPSNYGQAVAFIASLTPQYSGTVKGTVTFYAGTKELATRSLTGGVASFTISTLARETHTITATFNGNINFLSSSASLTQTVK